MTKGVGGSQSGKGGCINGQDYVVVEKGWVGVESADTTCTEAYSKVKSFSFKSTFSSQEKMLFKCGFPHLAFYNVLQRRLNDLGGDTTHIDIVPSNLILSIIICTKPKDV